MFIEVSIPKNKSIELEYIIQVVFQDFLQIKNYIISETSMNYLIIKKKNKEIKISCGYLSTLGSEKILPMNGQYCEILNTKLPLLYGEDKFVEGQDKTYCGIDIFATIFFFLSRWEEELIEDKDTEGRINENKLWTVRNGYEKRAIVDEYVSVLRKMLDIEDVNSPKVLITHDVDWCYLSGLGTLAKNINNLIRHRQYKKAHSAFRKYTYYRVRHINPFNCFDEIMDITNSYGYKNHFYFKATEKSEDGATYDINKESVKNNINNILERNNYIGFHPSENTVNNYEQFVAENKRLVKVTNGKIFGGRNHGLLYNQDMYSFWDKSGLFYDSGSGFQYRNGFRCGTCTPFRMFNLKERRALNLYQIPFHVMDSVSIRKKIPENIFYNDVKDIAKEVKKYNGVFCMNWHTNLFNIKERLKYKDVYRDVLDYLSSEGFDNFEVCSGK